VRTSVDTSKPFLYDEKLGLYWHKSWNIPTMTITVNVQSITIFFKIRDKRTQKQMRLPEGLSAQLYAVKLTKLKDGKEVLQDLGLRGIPYKHIEQNAAEFAGLKFITTSYYHEVFAYQIIFH